MEIIDNNLKDLMWTYKARKIQGKNLLWLNEVLDSWTFEKWARYVAKHWMADWYDYRNRIWEVQDYVEDKTNGEYSLALNYYGGIANPVYIKHNCKDCGNHKFWVNYSKINLVKNLCPVCKPDVSLGEKAIKNFLSNKKISFEPQYSFDDLKGKNNKSMPFDFAVFDKKKKLSFLIEFDGIYHYSVNRRNTPELLISQQSRDKRKDKYCVDHKLDLLRIPYWDFKNIEQILIQKIEEKDL